MHWTDWIVTPLMGAVIGYFTNWLAIKMLFRPHTEKRVFGIRLPFTPGLIPKEKLRLAKAMGETLSENVLTKDVLADSLASPAVRENISEAIDTGFCALATSDDTADDLLAKLLGEEKTATLDKIEAQLLQGISSLLSGEDMQQECRRLVADRLESFLRDPGAVLPTDALYNAIREYIGDKGLSYVRSEAFSPTLQSFIHNIVGNLTVEGKTVGDFIPARVADEAKSLLARKTPDLVSLLENLPQQYPSLDGFLRDMVSQLAEQHFGRFIGIFVHYDELYDKIKVNLFEYLSVPENQLELHEKASAWMDRLLETEVQTLLANFPEDSRTALVEKLATRIQDGIEETHVEQAFRFIADKAAGLSHLDTHALVTDIFPALKDSACDFVCSFITDELAKLAPRLTSSLRRKLTEIRPAQLLIRLSEAQQAQWKARLLNALCLALAKGGAHIVNAFNITKMVEDKISAFSPAEAETLVVSVVNKELRAITNLGALLGLVIGFVPLILNLFR